VTWPLYRVIVDGIGIVFIEDDDSPFLYWFFFAIITTLVSFYLLSDPRLDYFLCSFSAHQGFFPFNPQSPTSHLAFGGLRRESRRLQPTLGFFFLSLPIPVLFSPPRTSYSRVSSCLSWHFIPKYWRQVFSSVEPRADRDFSLEDVWSSAFVREIPFLWFPPFLTIRPDEGALSPFGPYSGRDQTTGMLAPSDSDDGLIGRPYFFGQSNLLYAF